MKRNILIASVLLAALSAGCSQAGPRERLGAMGIEYSASAFVSRAAAGDEEAVRLFLESGMDPDAQNEQGVTALMEAAYHSHPAIVGLLLERGAKLNIEDRHGQRALDYAGRDPSSGIFAELTERGALYGGLKKTDGSDESRQHTHDHPGRR